MGPPAQQDQCREELNGRADLAVLRGVVAARAPAGEITHTAVIVACGRCRRAERALQFFEEVLMQGLQPQVTSCTAATSACRKGRIAERALQIFEEMRRQGL